jgi:hypothetical protein
MCGNTSIITITFLLKSEDTRLLGRVFIRLHCEKVCRVVACEVTYQAVLSASMLMVENEDFETHYHLSVCLLNQFCCNHG